MNHLYKQILEEVKAGNVNMSESGDLQIFKYSLDCVYGKKWNDVNRLCRGIIFHKDGTLIARPFPKFFNVEELTEAEIPWDQPFEIQEKMDGSLGIGYFHDGKWKLATPGSLTSDQAIYGTKLLNSCYIDSQDWLPKNCTPLFEIIYPENRIVVDYGDKPLLILLSVFELDGTEWSPKSVRALSDLCGFGQPKLYEFDPRKQINFEPNSEGYVVRFESGFRVKIKSPQYVKIHKLLDYMSPQGVIDLIRANEMDSVLAILPNAIRQDFDDIRAMLLRSYSELEALATATLTSLPTGNRKEQAIYIQQNSSKKIWPVIFMMMDKKDTKDYIWKIVLEDL